jgi:hypothetical protein
MTRTIGIIVTCVFLNWHLLIQSDVNPTKSDSKEVPSLRLVLTSASACVGVKVIEAEVVLRNSTKSPVSFDLELFHQSMLFFVGGSLNHRKVGTTTAKGYSVSWPELSVAPSNQLITVRPGDSYWESTKIPLKAEIFEKPGFFNVIATYNAIAIGSAHRSDHLPGPVIPEVSDSNTAYFQVEACGPVPSRKATR